MPITDPQLIGEDTVSILSLDDDLDDYALPGSHTRIQRWISQQCRFGLEGALPTKEEAYVPGSYGIGGPGELPRLSALLMKQLESSIAMSVEGEAALRADSPVLGFSGETLMDPLHFPSPTYIRDLPEENNVRFLPFIYVSS